MAIACILLWIMAVNYQVNVAYALVFWLLGILLFGALAGIRQLTGLVLTIVPQQEYFAGKDCVLTLRVCDSCKRTRWLWLQTAQEITGTASDWQLWTITPENTDFVWTLPPQRRGLLPTLILAGASMAPFGLLMIKTHWEFTDEIVIFPEPVEHNIPAARTSDDKQSTQISLSGQDPAYLLPHQNTTSPRQIAWKHYAKTGDLLDKYFEQGSAEVQPLLISYHDYPQGTSLEKMASMMCYRVLAADASGEKYILELPRQRFEAATAQRTQCLNALGRW
ncbi:hypothetical protein BGI30_11970 [Snodgrassella alvi]|uniref:DUF58 domain-containing protein n=1 Tax=Snodgrassella alvi TaxID=1196083 RepID=A0A855FW58_9NEIS|nr:hypothetical protein BGI30_11970 [Snodgrassella alvi]PIT28552.1 hypothetical protein BGI37_02765 [Snodgrassella alvi]PIT50082.1 hypothetical protein BHC51_01300 [Snodgrassella alvi]PIT57639.1 hypothetical protein BHC59_03545 [Snodgrassella alvi]PIT60156.1 hypothetical protein BHC57_05790 [Snodgrassella alvi]